MSQILFITGTGTGVGKTVLTALLLQHLRASGESALALKPFCSGSRDDARLLHQLQKEDVSLDETNPFFFREPLAPWVAARVNAGAPTPLPIALAKIRAAAKRCEILLIEGSGGVLVPLGDNYTVADLIAKTASKTLVVTPNSLGTINHTLLTVKYLQSIGVKELAVVMMEVQKPDLSSKSNKNAIVEALPSVPVFLVSYLGRRAENVTKVRQNAKNLKKTLAEMVGGG